MIFQYTALNGQGGRLTDTIEAEHMAAAQKELISRGLFVLDVGPARSGRRAAVIEPARSSPARSGHASPVSAGATVTNARSGELVLFAKQMGMMLQAGASVVPALRAMQDQPCRAAWRTVLMDLADRVEGGSTLCEAMAQHGRCFSGTMRSIVGAGESTGQLGPAMIHMARLQETRHRVRQKIIGSLAYPALLILLANGVVLTMIFFILPRFATLFEMLDSKLPTITVMMLNVATQLRVWWPAALGLPLLLVGGVYYWARSESGRTFLGRAVFHVPFLGPAYASVMLTQVLQLWAAALRSRVPLLEAIEHAREVSKNVMLQELVNGVASAVSQGHGLSQPMKRFNFVPAPVLAAVATGEESGKLGEALDFAGSWLEEESASLISGLTRLFEPMILIFMGLVVGSVAVSLFLPLFDLATAA